MDTRTLISTAHPDSGFAKQGLSVPAVALGCTSMTPFSSPNHPRYEEMVRTLREVYEAGVSFFDTSEIQGPFTGEEMLGKALGNRGVVCTKFGWEIDGTTPNGKLNSKPETIRASAHGSLQRLQRDRIEVYMQHRVDPEVPIEDVAGTVGELISTGEVGALGLCEASPETIRRAHAVCPVSVVQYEYSIWTREPEEQLLDLCAELDISFMAYSPLGKGFLAGTAQPNDDASSPRLHRENYARNREFGAALAKLAADMGRTPASLALGWLLAQRDFIFPVAGSTNAERIVANTETTALTAEEVERVENLYRGFNIAGNRYTDKHLSYVERN